MYGARVLEAQTPRPVPGPRLRARRRAVGRRPALVRRARESVAQDLGRSAPTARGHLAASALWRGPALPRRPGNVIPHRSLPFHQATRRVRSEDAGDAGGRGLSRLCHPGRASVRRRDRPVTSIGTGRSRDRPHPCDRTLILPYFHPLVCPERSYRLLVLSNTPLVSAN